MKTATKKKGVKTAAAKKKAEAQNPVKKKVVKALKLVGKRGEEEVVPVTLLTAADLLAKIELEARLSTLSSTMESIYSTTIWTRN